MSTGRPYFISLDGVDGVGKSTQVERLAEHLTSLGRDVLPLQDPGSTEIGAKLRSILLDTDLRIHRRTEAMLFMASRCEMVETIIRPALAAGKTVISDRFLLANVVYQSVGGEVDAETLWRLGDLSNGGLHPDLTLLLDMPADSALSRLARQADRMEGRGVEYMESVRQAFLKQLPHSSPNRRIINADQSVDRVTQEIISAVDADLRES